MRTNSLPPGFRFHPTDEELIVHYLRNQASSKPCPVPIIPAVNIYKFDPWQLPEKSELVEGEWYFFTPRDRKYPNGGRPNRAAVSGYWKATGTDKAIYSKSKHVGLKKALVFYRGRPPKGSKTGWIMHEYRLDGSFANTNSTMSSKVLDEWVLCRIYEKKHHGRNRNNINTNMIEDAQECSPSEETVVTDSTKLSEFEEKKHVFPRSCSLARLLEPDYLTSSASFLVDESPFFNSLDEIFESKVGSNNGTLFGFPIHVDPLFFPFH